MIKRYKHSIVAVLLMLTVIVSGITQMTVFADEHENTDFTEMRIDNFNISQIGGHTRMAKGHNYTFDIASGINNKIATISGTVIFDYKNGMAKVQSAGTPKVTKYDSGAKVTATASGSTDGSTAVVTIKVSVYQSIFVGKVFTLKIKCTGNGAISEEYL